MNLDKQTLLFIQQAGQLMNMPRTHQRTLGTTFDTVASHSFLVAIIAYSLARMENLTHDQAIKAMTMGLLHDLLESRTGDQDFISKNYTQVNEDQAIKDQFSIIPFGSELEAIVKEYEHRSSQEAVIAKDADRVAQVYTEWVLMWQGNKLAERWFEGDKTHRKYDTESASKLVKAMDTSTPHEWWWKELVESGINSEHLNGKSST